MDVKSISYCNSIISAFQHASNEDIAAGQSAYMKYNFEFFGIKSPERHSIQRGYFKKDQLPNKDLLLEIIKHFWSEPQRELQYCAMELSLKYKRQQEEIDISLYEYMVTHKSWWDTVDFIASNMIGNYFIAYPDKTYQYIEKWLDSENLWLQRSALLFQLKYKNDVDTNLLEYIINRLNGSNEFFINKAIGWILREYSKTNPEWVFDFVDKTDLSNLSHREATKYLKKTKVWRRP